MLKKNPESLELRLFHSICLGYLGDNEGMMRDVEDVLDTHPDHPKATILQALAHANDHKFKLARKLLKKGEQLLGTKEELCFVNGERLNKKEKAAILKHLRFYSDKFLVSYFSDHFQAEPSYTMFP